MRRMVQTSLFPPITLAEWQSAVASGLVGPPLDHLTAYSVLRQTAASVIFACRDERVQEHRVLKLTPIPVDARVNDSKCAPTSVAKVRQLDHPHLVRVHHEGTLYLQDSIVNYSLMERVMGESLATLVYTHPDVLTIGCLLHHLRGVAGALDAMHGCGVLHRDVKPDNIFVDHEARIAKLGDLGIARRIDETAGPDEPVWGTPEFMAPEQIISNRYGPAVDIYALAVTLYHLFSRLFPFDAIHPRDWLYAHVHSAPIPLHRRNRNWPRALSRALERSLSKEPGDRHPTASALIIDAASALEVMTPFRLSTYLEGRFSSGEVERPNWEQLRLERSSEDR